MKRKRLKKKRWSKVLCIFWHAGAGTEADMEPKQGWFPQRKPKPLEYPICAGCKQPIVRTLPVREQGLVAHDARCLKRAVRMQEQRSSRPDEG